MLNDSKCDSKHDYYDNNADSSQSYICLHISKEEGEACSENVRNLIQVLNVQHIFSYWRYWEGRGCIHPETSRALCLRSWKLDALNGSERLNTRMSADVHVIPACHGSAASTDFPLFVHLHNWRIHPLVCPTPATVHETYGLQISFRDTLFEIRIYNILRKRLYKY